MTFDTQMLISQVVVVVLFIYSIYIMSEWK